MCSHQRKCVQEEIKTISSQYMLWALCMTHLCGFCPFPASHAYSLTQVVAMEMLKASEVFQPHFALFEGFSFSDEFEALTT